MKCDFCRVLLVGIGTLKSTEVVWVCLRHLLSSILYTFGAWMGFIPQDGQQTETVVKTGAAVALMVCKLSP